MERERSSQGQTERVLKGVRRTGRHPKMENLKGGGGGEGRVGGWERLRERVRGRVERGKERDRERVCVRERECV